MTEKGFLPTDIGSWLINVLPTKQEVTSLIGVDSPVNITQNEIQFVEVRKSSSTWSTVVTRCSPMKLVVFVTTGVAAAYCGVVIYKNFNANYTHITVIETVTLPSETTESFVHIGMPLSGEIQLKCDMLSHCKFAMKLNTSLKTEVTGSYKSATRVRRVSEDYLENSAGSLNNNDIECNSNVGSIAKYKISVTDVVMNSICDAWTSEQSGKLHFAPSCQTDSIILMRYNSCSHESFQAPVAVKQCMVQPASAPNAHRLNFELCIVGPALDVAINIIFPKGAQVLSINHNYKGHWQPVGACAPNEIVWHVGTFTSADGDSSYGGSTDNLGASRKISALYLMGKLSQIRNFLRDCWYGLKGVRKPFTDVRNVRFDAVNGDSFMGQGNAEAQGSNGNVLETATSSDFDHVHSPAPVELMAMDQMLALGGRSPMVHIPFEALYTITADKTGGMSSLNPSPINSSSNRASNSCKGKENEHMQHSRTQSEEIDLSNLRRSVNFPTATECLDFDPNIHVPALCLAYSTNVSASGILVRNLRTVEEQPNYNLTKDLLGHSHMLSAYAEHVDDAQLSQKQRIIKKCIVYGFNVYMVVNTIIKNSYNQLRFVVTNEIRHEEKVEAEWERRQKIAEAAAKRRASENNRGRNATTRLSVSQNSPRGFKDTTHSDPEEIFSRTTNDRENPSGIYGLSQEGADISIERSLCAENRVEQKVVLMTDDEERPNIPTPPPLPTIKLAKKVRYLTHFIQQVPVVPSY